MKKSRVGCCVPYHRNSRHVHFLPKGGRVFSSPSAKRFQPDGFAKGNASRHWKGCRVSFMTLNAKRLTSSRNGLKVVEFSQLLKNMKWPAIVVVTEVDGVAGRTKLEDQLGPGITDWYHVRYTMRSVGLDGLSAPRGHRIVGGGVALLVNKRLCVTIREAHIPGVSQEEEKWIDGHMRVWRLDPDLSVHNSRRYRSSAIYRPIYVTGAYVPPRDHDGWGTKTREILFRAMAASDAAIQQLRLTQDVFAITMEHSNAPDGGCPLPLVFNSNWRAPPLPVCTGGANVPGGSIEMKFDGSLMLVRARPALTRMNNVTENDLREGENVSLAAARSGLIALAGVLGHRQSTSWTACALCQSDARSPKCTKKQCGRMRSVHDQVRVLAELVYLARTAPNGGRHLLRYCVRRIRWSQKIDHAVSHGFFFLHPMQTNVAAEIPSVSPVKTVRAPRRRQFSAVLRERSVDLRQIAAESRRLMEEQPAPPVWDLDGYNDWLVNVLRQATGTLPPPPSQNESVSVRTAYRARSVTRHELHVALMSRKLKTHYGSTVYQQTELIRRLGKKLKEAEHTLATARALERSKAAERDRNAAPSRYWANCKLAATDPGASPVPICKLRDGLNDGEQRLISTDWPTTQAHALEHRKQTYRYRSDLGEDCEQELNDALIHVYEMSKLTMANDHNHLFVPESFVAQSAADPLFPINYIDQRRGIRRDLSAAQSRYSAACSRFNIDRTCDLSRGEKVHRLFPAECARLQRDIELQEVTTIFAKQRDVGPGVDGLSAIVLQLQATGITVEKVWILLCEIFNTGATPTQCRERRCLLCYKGKSSDPHCLDNYRGLGIDQLVIKLLSLVMNERLVTFLTATGGLSKSQGGFQRQRGTPEQIFTLTETVRAALQQSTVHLCFIDIEKAYDTVLHPILWKKCMDRGIDGRFLTALQAIYYGAVVTLELAGERIVDPIVVECGVMQGNPLSPALFNIYIDDSLRDLEEYGHQHGRTVGNRDWGLPLPQVCGNGDMTPLLPENLRSQADYLVSLFFADDGVLMETDVTRLQSMLEVLQASLKRVGLLFNIGKTKWMVVAPQSLTGHDDNRPKRGKNRASAEQNAAYQQLKSSMLAQHQLKINNISIKTVDYFNYLGAMVSWRWSWHAAWRAAVKKAHYCADCMQRGGFQNAGYSLFDQLNNVRAKIACHFNYIAAVSGSGGRSRGAPNSISAPWTGAEDVISRALCVIAGFPFADTDALKAESGTWDQQTRIDMLLLRFWCKILTMDSTSTTYRAMGLSIASLSASQQSHPATADQELDRLHCQPWAQQLSAALQRYRLPALDPQCVTQSFVVVQIDKLKNGQFEDMQHPLLLSQSQRDYQDALIYLSALPLRLVVSHPAGRQPLYIEGVNMWVLPIGTRYSSALCTWSPMLRAACYSGLKQRGNERRQYLVQSILQRIVERTDGAKYGAEEPSHGTRRWPEVKAASYLEPYWYLPDYRRAQCLLRVRLDCAHNEDYDRRRPQERRVSGRHDVPTMILKYPRIDNRALRACYNCAAIDGVTGVYRPETIEHVLCHCTAFEARRAQFRADIMAIASSPIAVDISTYAGVALPCLDGTSDSACTALLTLLRLCTSCGPTSSYRLLQPVPVPTGWPPLPRSQADRALIVELAWRRRARPEFLYDQPTARATACWIAALTNDWIDCVRTPRAQVEASALPGAQLATCVADYLWSLFRHRRTLVRTSDEFLHRRRDDHVRTAASTSRLDDCPEDHPRGTTGELITHAVGDTSSLSSAQGTPPHRRQGRSAQGRHVHFEMDVSVQNVNSLSDVYFALDR